MTGYRRTLPQQSDGRETQVLPLLGDRLVNIHSYHRSRERAEDAMSAQADSSVARIAHRKLAALHAKVADEEVAVHFRALESVAAVPPRTNR